MNPDSVFCHNPRCCARGQGGQGNIRVYSRQQQRYRCAVCVKTFVARKGTVWEGVRKPEGLVICVLTLLAHGCPVQAMVAAMGMDERTVAAWQKRAGQHCQRVHEHLMAGASLSLVYVQADELRVKAGGQVVWLASAMLVSTRLWLGGVVRRQRDRALSLALMQQVRACCGSLSQALLLGVDGLVS